MEEILSQVKKVYLVGIGGSGMSGLALLLKDKGFEVSGSDLKNNATTKALVSEGIKVFIGHRAAQVGSDIDILGFSSAVDRNNPELKEAAQRGITILRRGKLLAELSKNNKTIAVAGSHGKTTTTSLLGHALMSLGYKTTMFIGGLPLNYSRAAWLGGEYFVIETDESDGSFLEFSPLVSIITNIDHEHLDHYQSFDNLKKAFWEFASQTKDKVIAWGDDGLVSEIITARGGISFGFKDNNLIRADNLKLDKTGSCFDLYMKGKLATRIKIPLLGKHNCLNALAVLAFFYHLGEDLAKVNQSLLSFQGTKRRFQIKGIFSGVTFIDDYAHHPSEIRAVLAAARVFKPRRIVVVWEPHRFSRLARLKLEFLRSLEAADKVIVTDIYRASEEPDQALDARSFLEVSSKDFSGKIEYVSKAELSQKVPLGLEKDDLVLGLGAGDINNLMIEIVDEFKRIRAKT